MSHPILERHLERRQLRPLYLFFGEEEFLMQRALKRLEEALRDQTGEAPLKVTREATETPLAEFLAETRVGSLWGSGQLLVLRRAEAVPAAELQAVTDYLSHPAPRTWVVLLAEGLKARDLARNPVWSGVQAADAALGFFRLKEEELYRWLTREAGTLGKNLTLAAAQRLVEIVGENLWELMQELEKLALYAGKEKSLTPNLVNQLATHSRTYNIFALVDALGEAGVQKRLTALAQLLDLGEEPPKILGMLARQLRFLIRMKEGGAGLNLPQWHMKKLAQQAENFSEAALRSHLLRLHQTDLHLKTSAGNPRLWLEWTLLHLGPG